MVCGMQAPQQTDLMPEIVIQEMSEFPHDISVNKPVPGEACFDHRILLEKPDAESHGRNGNKSSDHRIQHIGKEGDLIVQELEFPVKEGHQDLQHEYDGKKGHKYGKESLQSGQRTIVA
jgi:hypothetical protein